jgi:putative transposase
VQPGQGVKINRIYYWSNVLNNPEVEGNQVAVRYDPFNMGVAYAYVKNRWVELKSEYHLEIANRTEKEIKIAFEEIKQRKKVHGQNISFTAKKLVEFLRSAQAEEKLLLQRLRDQETKRMFTVIEGGKSNKNENKPSSITNKQNVKPNIKNMNQEVQKQRIVYGEF